MGHSSPIPETKFLPLRRVDYELLVQAGRFAEAKVELIRGRLIEMSPCGARHAKRRATLTRLFVVALLGRAEVRPQSSFAATDDSEPEPDLAIVDLDAGDRELPSKAHLVIEVADSSLRFDREVKAPLYASAGIPEYWIVDVEHERVLVHRLPTDDGYGELRTLTRGDSIALLAFPEIALRVDEIFS